MAGLIDWYIYELIDKRMKGRGVKKVELDEMSGE